MQLKTSLALVVSAVLLTACGGGSDSSPAVSVASTSVATFPLDRVYTQVSTTGISLNATAVDGADTFILSVSLAPAADQTFEGVTAKKSVQAITIKRNGVTFSASGSEDFFTINPYSVKGQINNDGTYGVQTVAAKPFSNTAKVGDSGSLGTMTIYSNSSKSSISMVEQSTWTLEADTETTAFSCINSVLKDASGDLIATGASCLKIDTSGTVRGLRFTIAVPGKTLIFR